MNDNTKPLQDLLYNFTVLHERWVADKLDLTKQIIKTEQLVKEFSVRINEFDQINATTREKLNTTLNGAFLKTSEITIKALKQTIAEELKSAIDELQKVAIVTQQETKMWQQKAVNSMYKEYDGTLNSDKIFENYRV